MKITTVEIDDFLALGRVVFNLNDKGLVLVQGDNQDDSSASSNGAGKSSLVDAISWCLWGKTARGESGNAVIRRGQKETMTMVDIHDQADHWNIKRTRKKGKEEIFITNSVLGGSGVWTDLSKGTLALNQAFIQTILGCTEEVFNAAVYVGQEQMPDLPAMTDKTLKEIIEQAAGVTQLEAAYSLAREKFRSVEIARDTHGRDVTHHEALLVANIDNINREKLHLKNWSEAIAEQINQLKRDREDLNEQIDTNIESAKKHRLQTVIEADLLTLDKTMEGFQAKRDEENRLLAVATAAERTRDRLSDRLMTLAKDAKRLIAEVGTVEARIGTPCGECGTLMEEGHIHSAKSTAEARRDAARGAVTAERGVWESTKTAAAEARAALATYQMNIPDQNTVMSQWRKITEELVSVKDLQRHRARDVSEKLNVIQKTLELTNKENPHEKAIFDLVKDGSKITKDVHHAKTLLEDHTSLLQMHAQAVEVFSPKGVRAHILDTVTPYLNARTAEYLNILSDGNISAIWSTLQKNAKGELKERFAIDVSKTNGSESFLGLSGGEKRKVRVSCALALQDLVASRATKPFALWVADEIDTALDGSGLERLMMVLQEKARERGTVLVISHSDLRDWIDTVWTMTLSGGRSTLST